MDKLLVIWNAILAALLTREQLEDPTCAAVYDSDFDATGELRGIGEIIDYGYSAGSGYAMSDEPTVGGGLRPRLPVNTPAYMSQIIMATWQQTGEGLEDGALVDDTPALVSSAHWECSSEGKWEYHPALYEGGRLAHERDEYVKAQREDAVEPTGFAENPRSTYLWRQERTREERTAKMLQTIAHGPLSRVLKARGAIKTRRNESICATLGIRLPKSGSWPGVEAHSEHGMVRVYTDSKGVEVTRIPDWSNVWLTKSQQADLLLAIEQRLNSETVVAAKLTSETETPCCRCDTVTGRIAYDPATGVPLCQPCWVECNPGEVTIAQVALDARPVDWDTELAEGLLATL